MDLTVMHINKGNVHGTQGERSNPANSNEYLLLQVYLSSWFNTLHMSTTSHVAQIFLTYNPGQNILGQL